MSSTVILPFTLIIIGVIAILTLYAMRSDKPRVVNGAPSVLTSFGIFGTFLGITVGLAGFIPGDIAGSVPRLFEGIKLAFWTSVAGILGGILVKLRLLLFPLQADEPGKQVTASDMVAALRDVESSLTDADKSPLLASLRDLQEASSRRSEDLQKNLASLLGAMGASAERDEALAGSLAKMGESSEASLEEMKASSEAGLKAFAEMSEKQVEALAKQLSGDSSKLGDRLSAALGQNSKALAEALAGNRDAMAAQVTTAVTELRDALVGPDGAASELGKRMQQGQVDLAKALARATEGLRAAVAEDVGSLNERLAESSEAATQNVRGVAEAIESLQSAMGGNSAEMLARMDKLREGSDTLGDRLSESLTTALEGNRDAMAAQIASAVADMRDALVGEGGAAGALSDRLDALSDGLHGLAESVSSSFGEAAGGLSGDLTAMNTAIADAIDDLRMAIIGPEGATAGIAEEIRTAQKDTGKTLEAIHTALEENTQRQVDYSPRALLEVLEEMVRQFNTQFSGQFWEKFEGFNRGIAELLEWMETYRKQLGDMTVQQTRTTKNMDLAARRFDEIASRSEIFIDVSRNMSSLLGGLDAQRVQIESHLKQFAHVVDVTRDNLENIEERIVEGNEEMNTRIKEISGRIEEQVIRLDGALDEELAKAMGTLGQQLAALSEKFVEDYGPLTERLRELVQMAGKVKVK